MNQILLFKTATGWHAEHIGPHAESIVELFSTSIIPTGFTAKASADAVLARIQELNPGISVSIKE